MALKSNDFEYPDEDTVILTLKCCACPRTEKFEDQSKEDCLWQANLAGWTEDALGKDLCSACEEPEKEHYETCFKAK
jgi:hypothetical protein